MSISELIKQSINKKSYKDDYISAIKLSGTKSDSKIEALGQGLLTAVSKPLNDFIGIPIKNQIDKLRVGVDKFEEGIKQYSDIKDLEQKPFIDLNEFEKQTLTDFNESAKNNGKKFYDLSDDKQATLKGIETKQKQYEKYRNDIMGSEGKSATEFAGQAFGSILDKGLSGERTGEEGIAENITLGFTGIIGGTIDIVKNNIQELDEDETAYNIWKNTDLDNFDKIIKTAESFGKGIGLDIPGFNKEKYESKRIQYLENASKKIGSGLNESNNNGTLARTGEVMAGFVDFFFAPVIPLFEEEVTGKTAETLGAVVSLPFQALMSAGSESLQSAGVEKETADDWGLVIAVVGPLAIRKGKKPQEVAKEVSAETSFISSLPKQYQKMYVDLKGKIHEMQVLESEIKKPTVIKERTVLGEKTGVFTKTEGTSKGISNIAEKSKNFIRAMRDKNFDKAIEIKNELELTYKNLKENTKTKDTKKFRINKKAFTNLVEIFKGVKEINLSSKGIVKLIKEIDLLPLGDITSKTFKVAIASNVAKNTNDLGISFEEMDIVTNNIFEVLETKKTNIKKNMKDLFDYQESKKIAEESIEYGGITREEYNLEYKDHIGDTKKGIKENRKKYDLLKKLEADGIIKETSKTKNTKGDVRNYSITKEGEWVLPRKKLGIVENLYHYPDSLAKIFESREKVTNDLKTETAELFDFEKDIQKQSTFSTQLEKNFKKSGITAEGYIKKEIERVLQKKGKIARMEAEIENAQGGELLYKEAEYGGAPDVTGVPSTYPKWIPTQLRDKKLLLSTWGKLIKGNINIPDKNIRQQKAMSMFLEHLGSELKDIYEVDLGALTKDTNTKRIQALKEKLKNSKSFSRAYYKEYKKVNREVAVLTDRLEKLKNGSAEVKQKLREQITELKDTYATRNRIIKEIKNEYFLTDKEFDKLLKTKNYLKFDNFKFKEFALKLEKDAFDTATLKFTRIELEQKIKQKELTNIENIFEVYELPRKLADFNIGEFEKLFDLIDTFEQGDTFLSTTLMKRFRVIENGDISTVREAIQSMFEDLPGLKDYSITQKQAGTKIYEARIVELNKHKTELQSELLDKPLGKTEIETEIKEVESELNKIEKEFKSFTNTDIKDINFKSKKDKTTNEKVTENKLIEGGWADKISYDSALADKNPLYEFMVKSYITERTKNASKILEIKDNLGVLLKKSRQSTSRSLKEKLIPTDDIVVDYIEASVEQKAEMILDDKLTSENLELAHFVQELFISFRQELSKRKVVDKFLDEYVTHMAKSIPEVYKDSGFKEALKQIIAKEEHKFDFGALGDRDTVLGFEKFFKYGIERKGGQTYTKNLGHIVSGYTNTFYKKIALDEIIPKTVLYRDILADSSATKFVTTWINNKKGISVTDLQGTGVDKILTGLKSLISFMDLGYNVITAGASAGGVIASNYIVLGGPGYATGLKRKASPQGRKILQDHEAQIGRNPLWNLGKEVINAPDVTPLEIPMQLAFVMLGQTLQSGLNTAFLGKLTKKEFDSGVIPDERIAEIYNELGAGHALPGTNSVYGNTFLGKAAMMYRSWAVPLLYTNGRLAKRLTTGQSKKEGTLKTDLQMIGRSAFVPIALYVLISNWLDEDESYIKKRLKQEITSPLGAVDGEMWLGVPRIMGKLGNILTALKELGAGDKYAVTKEGEYDKGDFKGWAHLKKELTPGFIKQLSVIGKEFEEKKSSSGDKGSKLDRLDKLNKLDKVSKLDKLDKLDKLNKLK